MGTYNIERDARTSLYKRSYCNIRELPILTRGLKYLSRWFLLYLNIFLRFNCIWLRKSKSKRYYCTIWVIAKYYLIYLVFEYSLQSDYDTTTSEYQYWLWSFSLDKIDYHDLSNGWIFHHGFNVQSKPS